MNEDRKIEEKAVAYTAAWCSGNPANVAAHFAETGSLTINDGAPAVGRVAIGASAHSFMTAFPDLLVTMDSLEVEGRMATYRWTLTGTNTGPGGTGNVVRISGYEQWKIGAAGLIDESLGHFDEVDYGRQISEIPDGNT